ncbi:hypothetical protein [Nonomuraea guangzhouensis]|uniref:Magnesium transporter CorA n=1 Tax=Nonomuraea guangzhouensis TaxID=1291555 RepID=A0ABW4GD18_9ACTN|nr:hypothetical protein [Nonomuraea guangzhouensis]
MTLFGIRPAQGVRLTNIFATPWHVTDGAEAAPSGDRPRLGRPETYFTSSATPRVLHRMALDQGKIEFADWDRPLAGARLWLFAVPSTQIVAVLSLDIECELADTVDLLEDCFYGDLKIDGRPLEAVAAELAGATGGFFPERHQLAFAPQLPAADSNGIVQRVIYRGDLPNRDEFSTITYPSELNRRPETTAAVSTYVSVLCGQPDYVEDGIFLSAVQGVASAARLREIRSVAYQAVEAFRGRDRARQDTRDRRRSLSSLTSQLGDLELDLSYSVEATADLGMLVPSLRVAGYHDALYETMGLVGKAENVARMLERLERAIRAELTTIESLERRADEDRQLRWSVAIGFVSAVAVPVTLVLTFFGVNAQEVDVRVSMFDGRYWGIYWLTAAIVVTGVVASLGLYLRQRHTMRREPPLNDD